MADSSNREVKKNNRIRTLRAVLAGGRISQPALAAELGHSGPTVLSNIRELIQLGLVEEIGVFDSTGGRRAKAFGPVADARLSIGLEITKSHIGLVAVDLAGSLMAYRRQEMTFSMSDAYFQQLAQRLEQFIQNEKLAPQRLLGVGISLPGIVDERERLLTDSHVLQLKDVSTDCFSRCLPYSCRFINDANAAGLAEVYQQEELKNLVYLSLSDSVGGAILIDGRLYAGDHRRAGELGHNTLVPNGRPCYCGKLGCLDSYCNAQILSGMTGGSLERFFEGVEERRPALLAAWNEYLENLAVAVNNLRMTFDCNVMAGGYVGSYLEEYGGDFSERLARRNPFEQDISYFKFCRHRLGASALGAALLLVEDFIRGL